ncbi:clan AA aspartic protease [Marinobacterium sp. AK62]|uniref:Clan AA aspartic protease n=1 Tax=Marinobacterium alkalitolerans TaxID=1542925 RepID=A0ABS3ZAY4_9GAMM|nr:retropepsin-like aspartic protease [Marinobacterium alkalitolerans]MBP0048863.1 clan AA aspartic protease [Marinobacterium alkalitolerans]
MKGGYNLLAGLLAFSLVATAQAEIFHYTDDRGRKIYVDRKSQIPAQYRDQVEVRKEESETLSRAERERRQQVLDSLEAQKGAQGRLAQLKAEMEALEQPADIQGNSVRIPVQIRYLTRSVSANLIVDTGASRTIIHRNIARRLGVTPRPSGQARVVGGAQLPLGIMPVEALTFGPVTLEDRELAVISPSEPLEYDGLLGMDVLSSLKYEIDIERGVVIWHADRYRELQAEHDEQLAIAGNDENKP